MPLSFHPLFRDHAVVQREAPLPVWGEGEPGTTVRVELAGGEAVGSVEADGRWLVRLPALPAGGPYGLLAESSTGERALSRDILIGDVFLCSGQSNMEWPLADTTEAAAAIASAADDGLRLLTVPKRTALFPRRDLNAAWQVSTPGTAPAFSAVGWHAGRALRQRDPAIPVGLINASWGGTAIESWLSPEELQHFPESNQARQQIVDLDRLRQQDPAAHQAMASSIWADFERNFLAWHQAILAADGGETAGFHQPDQALGAWRDHPMPAFWPNAVMGSHEGVAWFACDLDIPAACAGRDAILRLGSVDNEDTTWWNGQFVGGIDLRDGPDHWNLQRNHVVPGAAIRAGRNRIAVRVIDYGGRGGFGGGPQGMCLDFGTVQVALPATWRCRIGASLISQRPALPLVLNGPDALGPGCASSLFAGMIAPLIPASLAGILWYQGESNADRAEAYRALFAGLILDWRRWFRSESGAAPLPFVWAQLTAWRMPAERPGQRSTWAELREAQTRTLRLPATGQAVILDCGDAEDIHPRNKRVPGERLARHLSRLVHGDPHPANGPVVSGWEILGLQVCVRFAVTGGLVTRDGRPVAGFWITGSNRIWKIAQARIEGDTVIVSNPEIGTPAAVRYAWADNPVDANLTDGTGIPACPWRSDG